MSYCYCTPSRSLYWTEGSRGRLVSRTRQEASYRGWETRRHNLAMRAAWDEADKAKAEAERLTPFVIEGTGLVPVETIVVTPEAVEVGD